MSATEARELQMPLRHLRLAARAWGDPRNPPMLALHGWLDNAASFDRLAPLLEGHYLVALDLAGHGRSQHRGADNWSAYADYLGDLAEVLGWLGWDRFDLLGHSLGATLASLHAAIAPGRIERLLLVEGLGPLAANAANTLEQLRSALSARAAFKADRRRVFPAIDDAVSARHKAGDLSLDSARLIVERGIQRVPPTGDAPGGYVWSSDPRLTLASPQRFTEDQLAAVLPGIRAPTLLVLAEPAAPYLSREMIEARIALVPDIEVVRLPGHHHLHMDDAPRVAAAMRSFLERHPPVPAVDPSAA